MRFSEDKTPWAIDCQSHGLVYLTVSEYRRQLSEVENDWECPKCFKSAVFNEENYIKAMKVNRLTNERIS